MLTGLQLRYYQDESVDGLFRFFHEHKDVNENPIVALPTGTGKSIVIAEFILRSLTQWPSTRIMIATHVKELVDQDHKELLELWPTAPAGIYSAGLKRRDTHLPITFCGIASVAHRTEDFGRIDLLIVDECHMISHREETMYCKAIAALRRTNPHLRVIGLSATPYRLGLGMLTEGSLFTHISTDYTSFENFNRLVDDGFICPLVPRKTETELSVEGVGIQNGEFIAKQLQEAVDKERITRAALEEAVACGAGRRHWLVFTTGTKHADHARDILTELGVPAVSVHSDLPGGSEERDRNIRLFKAGEVGAMVGVNVFSTGFNFRPIDCITFLRPTMSPVFWVQALGRGTRPCPETGKENCLVLDFAANTRRLGPINDPVLPRKKGKKGNGMVPYKVCPACNTYNHARARFCIQCKAEFPQTFAGSTTASTEELIKREKPVKPAKQAQPEDEGRLEEYQVTRVEFAKHVSRDASKPPSLKVTYRCGLHIFQEWLCFESPSHYALHKAHDKWRLMAMAAQCEDQLDPPETVAEALARVEYLQPPSRIKVLVKAKFPDIVGYEFAVPPIAPPIEDLAGADDDIPF